MFSKAFWLRSLDKMTPFVQLHKNLSSMYNGGGVLALERAREISTFGRVRHSGIPENRSRRENLNRRCCFKRTFQTESAKCTFGSDEKNQVKAQDVTHDKGDNINVPTLLETWFYEVSPYGSLSVQLPFNTVIRPLNPQDYPDMNKCIIELHYNALDKESENGTELPNPHQLAQIAGLYSLDVSFDKDKAHMNLTCDAIQGLRPPVSCYLRVPLKYDLSLKMEGNESVTVENMEGNRIYIETNVGSINLKKNKSGSVSALSKSGDIVSKSTQLGNISMHCGNTGSITADKLQGSNVTCTTELGSVNLKSLYTETATFKTLTGDVHLGHCHGQICVVGEKSDIHIESLDGDLDVALQQGSVKVHLSRHNKVDVDLNTGNIDLSFPEGTKTNLNLSSASISVAENLPVQFDDTDAPYLKEGYIGKDGVAQVNARTMSGNIDLRMLDWIQTIKLAFGNRED